MTLLLAISRVRTTDYSRRQPQRMGFARFAHVPCVLLARSSRLTLSSPSSLRSVSGLYAEYSTDTLAALASAICPGTLPG